MDAISLFNNKPNPNIPDLSPGDTVKVSAKVGERGHPQVFQGVVIKVRRGADGGNFTIRRVSHGIGVEHTFSFASPLLGRIEVVRRGEGAPGQALLPARTQQQGVSNQREAGKRVEIT